MSQFAERRHAPRVRVELDVTLSRSKGGPVAARTLDISAGGMRAATRRPLRVDELLDVELALDDGAPAVTGHARVMREEALSVYGLRFEHLAGTDAARLARLTSTVDL
jgi:c-di-GMP-binding flagellar brake protein YcgR